MDTECPDDYSNLTEEQWEQFLIDYDPDIDFSRQFPSAALPDVPVFDATVDMSFVYSDGNSWVYYSDVSSDEAKDNIESLMNAGFEEDYLYLSDDNNEIYLFASSDQGSKLIFVYLYGQAYLGYEKV